jgi:hypothetical protein
MRRESRFGGCGLEPSRFDQSRGRIIGLGALRKAYRTVIGQTKSDWPLLNLGSGQFFFWDLKAGSSESLKPSLLLKSLPRNSDVVWLERFLLVFAPAMDAFNSLVRVFSGSGVLAHRNPMHRG